MDDELKRKIAASLDGPDDTAADPRVIAALENDPQAREYRRSLTSIDHALRRWPTRERTEAQWEDFAAAIERRLGESPWENTAKVRGVTQPLAWDPLDRPPLQDDATGVTNQSEHKSMAQSHDDKDNDDDLEGLAALTRTSLSPGPKSMPPASLRPGPALADDAMDDSSGIVDIEKLAAIALKQSAPPPASELKPNATDVAGATDAAVRAGESPTARAGAKAASVPPATSAKSESASTAGAKAESANDASPRARSTVAASGATAGAEPKKKTSPMVWALPLVAVAAGAMFMLNNRHEAASPSTASTADEPASTAAQGAAPAASNAAPAQPAAAENAPAPTTVAAAPPPAAPTPTEPAPAAAPTAAPAAPPPPPQVEARNEEARPAAAAASAHEAAPAREDHASSRRAERAEETRVAAAEPAPAEAPAHGGAHAAAASGHTTASETAAPSGGTTAAAHPATTTASAAPAATGTGSSASAGAGGHPRSIDELMAAATGSHGGSGGGSAAAAPAPSAQAAAPAELPQTLTRPQVTAVLAPLSSSVRACAQGATGMATVAVRIHNDGTVESASVSGPFTPEVSNCISGVVRRAHFPQFQRPVITIAYPFSIQPPRPGG